MNIHEIIQKKNEIFIILIIIILLIILLNNFFILGYNNILEKKYFEIKEAKRPAEIELIKIESKECIEDGFNECFNISSITEAVKNENVKIIKEETFFLDSEKAKELIERYKIEKIPALLIFGETNKTTLAGFKNENNALIFNEIKPLYLDLKTNEIKGRVSVKNIIDSSCKECLSLSTIFDSFGNSGVVIVDIKNIEYLSKEGQELIKKFEIKNIPTILVSKDIDYYSNIKKTLDQLNTSQKEGYYSLSSTFPPYKDLQDNKIVGLVDLIMLEDKTCKECYDVKINKQILARFSMFIKDEKTYDISSPQGKSIISKYKIQNVPIIIMSPDSNNYPSFVQAWDQIGSIEDDGWFVMRKPEIIGKSKNI